MSGYLQINTLNDEATIAKLRKIPAIARHVALDALGNYLVNFGGGQALTWYPPARPQSSYVRTFKLKNDWKYVVEGTRTVITNQTPYAIFPMGNPPAAKMRLLGWRGALERVQANLSKAVAYARMKVMQKIGG